jgi:voltage-gated potassium channel
VGAVGRIRRALFALGVVLLVGTLGYIALGFGPLDALYQTVTTITTVGFREVRPLSAVGKVFTILLILVGVGTALYALVELLEALIEGHLRQHLERRRMDREIGRLTGHVIICGWGRVGRASSQYLTQWVSMSPTPTEGTAFKVHSFRSIGGCCGASRTAPGRGSCRRWPARELDC